MPAILALLGGSVRCASTGGTREIDAADFFLGPLESALAADELATSVLFPALPAGTGTAIVEVSRRHGDYAVCGVAAIVTAGPDGRVTAARTSYISVGDMPPVLDLTAAVRGTDVADAGSAAWIDAAELAHAQLRPDGDIHATAAYRRHLVRVLTARALREAARRAPGVDVAA
jgi:carbon-monoxide dehydrogenase medium subunit